MEHINGIINKTKVAPAAVITDENESKTTKKKKQRPAQTLKNGRVITRIWANRTHWGAIHWRVDHYVENAFVDGGKQFSIDPSDLQDAMRGLYQAQRWIKKAEKRRRSFWCW